MNAKIRNQALAAGLLTMAAPTWAGEKIRIVSEWGEVNAQLEDNPSAGALLRMLPLQLLMNDHLRQEKTGRLRTPLPEHARKVDFASGDIGLWGNDAFVIYYARGTVPQPGIIPLGRIEGGATLYDRPGPIKVRIERAQ